METHRQYGAITLQRVTEQCGPGFTPTQLYPNWNPKYLESLRDVMIPSCFDVAQDKFIASIHTWVVRRGDQTILIDCCAGNDKVRPMIPRFHLQRSDFLDRLRAAGVDPRAVNFVLCTHLHADHCGWNTQLVDGRWVPTFPNARYLFSRAECAHWSGPAGQSGPNAGVYQDSVLPVIAAGQAEIVDDSDRIIDNLLRIHQTPGHSPGHLAFSITTDTDTLVFTGDLMHQPIQVAHPDLNTNFCVDPALSARSRRQMLDFAADSDGLVCTAHFAASSVGRVRRRGEVFGWAFE